MTNLKHHPPRLWSKICWSSGPFLSNISAAPFISGGINLLYGENTVIKLLKYCFITVVNKVFTHILNNKSNGVLKLRIHVENYLNDSGVFILIRSTIRIRLLYTSELIQHLLNKHELIRSYMEVFN